jgi:hypothetical protein
MSNESTDFPPFPFENPLKNLYFVSILLSKEKVEKIENLYNDIEGYNDLKVNIFDEEAPYGDGSKPVQYEFKEMFVLRLAMVIQEGEDDKSVAPPVTVSTLKKRYEKDGVLCFCFHEDNHPDIIKRDGQLHINYNFHTFVVLSESKENAFQFISSL